MSATIGDIMSYGTGLTRWQPRNSAPDAEWTTPPNILTVSIGRNIGGEPMDDTSWSLFRHDVGNALAATVGEPNFTIVGPGGGWEDIAEDSALFTVLSPLLITSNGLENLRTRLAQIRARYGQDAVALTLGNSELIGA